MYFQRILALITARQTWSTHHLIAVLAVILTVFDNVAFFRHLSSAYLHSNVLFMGALALVLLALNYIVLALLCYRPTIKPVAVFVLLVSAVAAYHMDTFDVVIDKVMLQNVTQTQTKEAMDLFTPKFLAYIVLLGVLPVWWVLRQSIKKTSFKVALMSKLKWMGVSLLLILVCAGVFNKSVASFAREHKATRFYTNPVTYLYSTVQFVSSRFTSQTKHLQAIGTDAKIVLSNPNAKNRKLMILIVGETARADHWSLNGYSKETNPLMAKESRLVSLRNLTSCGTSTAVSVPCMFTNLGRSGYSEKKFNNTENVLDVLNRAGVQIIWRDNNSSSKGVADRLSFADYKESKQNTMCEGECRDEGMLVGLQDHINQNANKDMLIVLHTMGSHGPAYYKRYPKAFEKFTPACQDNQLENCSVEAINNAFDNTIVYSDYVISKTIALLQANDSKFATSLIYVSDHGESLGENGVYLHGMPYAIAPAAQTHPAAAIWVGTHFNGMTPEKLKTIADKPLSHDNLFHTLLGSFEVQTEVYKPELDIFHLANNPTP